MSEDADFDALIKKIQADLRAGAGREQAGPSDQPSSSPHLRQVRGDRADRSAAFNFLLQFLIPGLIIACVGIVVAWSR
jgi:hypothetical protein